MTTAPETSRHVADVRPALLPPLDFHELASGDFATSLDAGVYFALDSAELTSKARSQLQYVLVPRAKSFLADGGDAILIEGYTDGLGPASYNRDLSLRRADGVAKLLVAGGIAPARIEASGHGEAGAVDGVADPAARRVVVVLHGGTQ